MKREKREKFPLLPTFFFFQWDSSTVSAKREEGEVEGKEEGEKVLINLPIQWKEVEEHRSTTETSYCGTSTYSIFVRQQLQSQPNMEI